MAAKTKTLKLTIPEMRKLHKQGASLAEIGKQAGCGWRTVKARIAAK
jgi:lambda repressor-like predicted transcriptional regulator